MTTRRNPFQNLISGGTSERLLVITVLQELCAGWFKNRVRTRNLHTKMMIFPMESQQKIINIQSIWSLIDL